MLLFRNGLCCFLRRRFGLLRLDRRNRDGIHNVCDQGTAAQVVHRFSEPLQHRPDRDGVCRTLHRLVRVVARAQTRKDENRGRPATSLSGSLTFATVASTAASY